MTELESGGNKYNSTFKILYSCIAVGSLALGVYELSAAPQREQSYNNAALARAEELQVCLGIVQANSTDDAPVARVNLSELTATQSTACGIDKALVTSNIKAAKSQMVENKVVPKGTDLNFNVDNVVVNLPTQESLVRSISYAKNDAADKNKTTTVVSVTGGAVLGAGAGLFLGMAGLLLADIAHELKSKRKKIQI